MLLNFFTYIFRERNRKYWIASVLIGVGLMGFTACDENPINRPTIFADPETSIVTEQIFVNLQGTVVLNWSGTVRDGFVGGYMVSFDTIRWGSNGRSAFTTRQDSTFRLTFFSLDTSFTLSVAAVRLDNGNGIYDTALIRGSQNFGPEPFTDLNQNGIYDAGEPFVDIGGIDPAPARVTFPVRNSPPSLLRRFVTLVPDTSLPVTQFEFSVSDPEGLNTLRAVQLSLNDSNFTPSNTVEVPVFSSDLTIIIESTSPKSSGITEANIYVGSNNTPLTNRLSNYRMNQPNVLYARAVDAPGALSNKIRVPSADSVWIPRPLSASALAIVDDFSPTDRDPFDATDGTNNPLPNERVLTSVFERIRNSKYVNPRYETILLKEPTSPNPFNAAARERIKRQTLQHKSGDVLKKILKLYEVVFWYSDNNPSFLPAQLALPDILNAGIDVLMTFGTSTDRDPTSISFSPAASARVVGQVWFTGNNAQFTNLVRVTPDTSYPQLSYNGNFRSGTYTTSSMDLQFNIDNPSDIIPLYSLPLSFPMIVQNQLDTSSRYVVSRRLYRQASQSAGRLVFCSVPMYRVIVRPDAPTITDTTALRRFYDTVFEKEFGQ